MGKQLKFYLTENEAQRLYEVAHQQCRRPHEQARFILLYSLGLVSGDINTTDPTDTSNKLTIGEPQRA